MFYKLSQIVSEYYVKIPLPHEIKRGCQNSEFQFLDHKELVIVLDEASGTEFPDLIMVERYVPMISDKLKKIFDTWGIDNLFYKKLVLKMPEYEIAEIFWLALPPRIDCLDPEAPLGKVSIITNKVGNYNIFMLRNGNDDVIITEEMKNMLADAIEQNNLQGIKIEAI